MQTEQVTGIDTSTLTRQAASISLIALQRSRVPHPDVFLMKLNASRGEDDLANLIRLWPACSFENAREVVEPGLRSRNPGGSNFGTKMPRIPELVGDFKE